MLSIKRLGKGAENVFTVWNPGADKPFAPDRVQFEKVV
jgi:hypothetical protein